MFRISFTRTGAHLARKCASASAHGSRGLSHKPVAVKVTAATEHRQKLRRARRPRRLLVEKLRRTVRPAPAKVTVHALMNASRSALIVSACVVGMPCGKPL